jgi:hypothetical protein
MSPLKFWSIATAIFTQLLSSLIINLALIAQNISFFVSMTGETMFVQD